MNKHKSNLCSSGNLFFYWLLNIKNINHEIFSKKTGLFLQTINKLLQQPTDLRNCSLWSTSPRGSLTSFESSDDHVLVVMMRSLGTQCSYTAHNALIAFWPSTVSSPPIRTRSGSFRSRTAVPSARNSGLDSTWSGSTTLETSSSAKVEELCSRDGTHLQVEAGFGVGVKYPSNALGGAHWHRTLLRDNLVAVGHLDNAPGARLDELQVSRATFPHPVSLCWGVHLEECKERCSLIMSVGQTSKTSVWWRTLMKFWSIIIGLCWTVYLEQDRNLMQKGEKWSKLETVSLQSRYTSQLSRTCSA